MLCTKGALFNYYTTEKLDMVMVFLEMNIKKKLSGRMLQGFILIVLGCLI